MLDISQLTADDIVDLRNELLKMGATITVDEVSLENGMACQVYAREKYAGLSLRQLAGTYAYYNNIKCRIFRDPDDFGGN